jgi:GTPase SAR1 family protein
MGDSYAVIAKEVMEELKSLYMNSVLPVEEACSYNTFGFSPLNAGEFDSPPLVLLVGPYSAGKTTFIEHLLGKQFPGERVGPEPTTDKFCAVLHGEDERVIPGNALTVTPGTPFKGLQMFGNNFLTRFEGAQVNVDILKNLTLIDSPGVLSGEKQTLGRSYSYDDVLNWFAERSDMIILLFDVQKLDISDEMGSAIRVLQKYSDKIKVVLNKSDSISHQQLMKVYGALLWSLGKVIDTPEVTRVYIGSFWNEPLKNEDTAPLLEMEMADLLRDLAALPRMGAVRKINDIVKRIRQVRTHAVILDYLRNQMPSMFGKEKKKKELLEELEKGLVFRTVMKQYNISVGDFPDLHKFKRDIEMLDFDNLPKLKGARMLKGKRIQDMEDALNTKIPAMLNRIPGINKP